jgi:hypothetical protein
MTQDTFNFDNGDDDDDEGNGRFTDYSRFGEARQYLEEHKDDGIRCPLCRQYAKIYKRKLNKTMVKCLRLLYNASRDGHFVHVMTIMAHEARASREIDKVALFGLVESNHERKEDGNKAGYWRIKISGVEFLRGRLSVPKYARVYNGELLGYKGEPVNIGKVAPEFRLDELMDDR